jgi:hypothetical protein
LKNIKQHISNFSYLLLCVRAIILKLGNFLLKGKVVGIFELNGLFHEVLAMGIICSFQLGFVFFVGTCSPGQVNPTGEWKGCK